MVVPLYGTLKGEHTAPGPGGPVVNEDFELVGFRAKGRGSIVGFMV